MFLEACIVSNGEPSSSAKVHVDTNST